MKRIPLFVLVASVLLLSCKKWLNDNVDPATPQKAAAHVMLPPMFAQMERGMAGDYRYIGRYVQNFGLNTSNDVYERHGYARSSDAMGEIWRTAYFGIGKNIDLMLEEAQNEQKWEFVGVGNALRAWCWQTATDYHGEIVLKHAFDTGRFNFDYDPQDTVYAEVRRLCAVSLEYFGRTEGKFGALVSFPSADLIYKGDLSKWRKFVNGILARNANNLSNKTGIYKPDEVIAYVNQSLSGNADNFIIPHGSGGSTNSENSNHYGPAKIPSIYPSLAGTYVQSNMIAQLMNGGIFNGVPDPRAPFMLVTSPDGQYRGVRPALGDPARNASATIINPTEIPNIYGIKSGTTPGVGTGRYLFKDDAGFPAMTFAELQFIKAEAAFRKSDRAMAHQAFIAGITANMDYLGVTTANRNTYLASAAVPQNAAALTLKDIMLQKYISLWAFGVLETWNDMRRYHYDTTVYRGYTLLPTTQYSTGTLFEDNLGKLAYRVRPRFNSEYVWNLESLKAVGGDRIDYHTIETWFSKP